jgi:hypothetical protein
MSFGSCDALGPCANLPSSATQYFEYDGKQFGFGSMSEEVGDFRGARKITSLGCFPLKYHKNESQLRRDLIERGKKFVALSGVHYKSHQGMAYYKKKRAIIKVNINGRIMVDPSIHRRINPNYPISLVRPKDHDIISDDEDSDDESGCGCDSDARVDGDEKIKYVTKVTKDRKGNIQYYRMAKFDDEEEGKEKLDQVPAKDEEAAQNDGEETTATEEDNKKPPEFTDEEYLIASPVVLGFAFAEKLWLEFTVSGVKEIQWNETAYESLVLEPKTKDIVKVCPPLFVSARRLIRRLLDPGTGRVPQVSCGRKHRRCHSRQGQGSSRYVESQHSAVETHPC